jgi:hypothetical protein
VNQIVNPCRSLMNPNSLVRVEGRRTGCGPAHGAAQREERDRRRIPHV